MTEELGEELPVAQKMVCILCKKKMPTSFRHNPNKTLMVTTAICDTCNTDYILEIRVRT